MQKKPSMTPTQFYNAQITHKIKESISAFQIHAKLGKGTNLPDVSALSTLTVTQENILQMKALRDQLSAVREAFLTKTIEEHANTKKLGNPILTKTREVLVEGNIKQIEQFDKHLEQFDNKIHATIKEGLEALTQPSGFNEEEIAGLQVMTQILTLAEEPAMINHLRQESRQTLADQSAKMPINFDEIKVYLNDNKSTFAKSNFANNTVTNVANTNNTFTTVINNQGTKTIQDTARQPTQHHKNKPGCCTIF